MKMMNIGLSYSLSSLEQLFSTWKTKGRREIGVFLQLQDWSNKLYRDEVVAEWKKVKGKMSLHVHCHISGGHFLLDLCARLRYFIFFKELPVVIQSFL